MTSPILYAILRTFLFQWSLETAFNPILKTMVPGPESPYTGPLEEGMLFKKAIKDYADGMEKEFFEVKIVKLYPSAGYVSFYHWDEENNLMSVMIGFTKCLRFYI